MPYVPLRPNRILAPVLIVGLLLMAILATPAAANVISSLYPDDAYVYDQLPTTVFSTATLFVGDKDGDGGSRTRAFLRFDVPNNVPDGSTINRAYLCLGVVDKGESFGVDVHLVEGDWAEHHVTWDDQPDYSPAIVATDYINATDTWFSWDLTPEVQAALDADRILDLALDAREEGVADAWCEFDSSDNATVKFHGQLVIDYTPGSGAVALPELYLDPSYLAQVSFPEHGLLDTVDLGTNHVRFDVPDNLVVAAKNAGARGDSLVAVIRPRDGAVLTPLPSLHYQLQRNVLFDAHRSTGLPDLGQVAGVQVADTLWAFDLPDTGFLFPGDVLHYYVRVDDFCDGCPEETATATLPRDLTSFGDFGAMSPYPTPYTFRALPTMESAVAGDQPPILLWDDSGRDGGTWAWRHALANLGYVEGVDFDFFATRDAAAGGAGGLGTSATAAQIEHYDTILYTSGAVNQGTLGGDIALLENWLADGNRHLFLTGDALAYDLSRGGVAAAAFLENRMGTQFESFRAVDPLQGQAAPLAVATPMNPVYWTVDTWLSVCPMAEEISCASDCINDLVSTAVDGVRLAEYLDPSGLPGQYPYAASILTAELATGNEVVFVPLAFANLSTVSVTTKAGASLPARTRLLHDVLVRFGHGPGGTPAGTADGAPRPRLLMHATPNPFNPLVRIEYALPTPGALTIEILDLKGQRVRTLVAGPADRVGHVVWDGTDAAGRAVAAGPYLYRAATREHEATGKIVLLK